ncbi:MAG: S-methyl-5-thioribose-1-phosphate isomerase [Gammaproteobacteria bacterium HGW-Gammaproteobacteria-3]|nr:MAG: S-methyl-5-thioribose-1-phosphate isomerase [Gammaproteobacteria bacterium HGW-Gammaproteobacteria-3]
MNESKHLPVQALQWTGTSLKVLDQRQLPQAVIYDEYHDTAGVVEAIKTMRVRGAPAIGIAAAFGVVLSVRRHSVKDPQQWRQSVAADIEVLSQSRPTAVNLFWALEQMKHLLAKASDQPVPEFLALAQKIHQDDLAANHTMGEMGADVLGDAQGLLTHCNTGALATGGYGTALGVIRSACQRAPRTIYAGETRPWLQGARLTVWELTQDGIPVTLIADSAAAWLMQSGAIDWVVVGADRIAANGDCANKIGTYALAVLARQHGVKFMVVAPTSTIDWTLPNGNGIAIEQRNSAELLPASYVYPDSLVTAWNPVFDVTPAALISAIVTERGVVIDPSEQGLEGLQQ